MSTSETIPGKAALLHWLQFAAIGQKDSHSRASRLAVNLSVCNEFPSTSTSEAVYQGLGEAMEQERYLGDLFDLVFTLPQTKPEPVKTSTQTVIDTSVVNLQSELLAQQQQSSRVTAPPPNIHPQNNTIVNLAPPSGTRPTAPPATGSTNTNRRNPATICKGTKHINSPSNPGA
jgi:hypothetical protein